MQNTATCINIKASNLGRLFLLLAYASLLLLVIWYSHPVTYWLVPLILLHGWWSWRQAFGVAAPKALLLKNNSISLQLASGELQLLQPPLLVHSRYCLVFKRSGGLAWPWLLWPDAVSASEHHQLRFFLRSWR